MTINRRWDDYPYEAQPLADCSLIVVVTAVVILRALLSVADRAKLETAI
jgi:hypothetical protein